MSEGSPLVSIIIPVYNGSNYLREAIDSALAQTYGNIEVIVVNDGSDDDSKTEKIAKSYGNEIRYMYKENGGVSSALNRGIQEMKGELFSWLSYDDLYCPDKIEKQVSSYLNNKVKTIIFSHSDTIDAAGNIIIRGKKLWLKEQHLYYHILANNFFISGCTLLIPRKAFAEVGLFSNKYQTVQDYDMWFRMINAGYQFKYLPLSTVKSRIHPHQDSKVKTELFLAEKNNLYINALKSLKSELWFDYWDNKAIALLLIARNYKRNKLFSAYSYALQLAKSELGRLSHYQKCLASIVYIYVLLWNKYFSPATYIYKGKYLLSSYKLKLTSNLNGK